MEAQEVLTLRLEGDCTIATAAEWKERLDAWLMSGTDLRLDLDGVEAMDVTLLQLLLASAREAARRGITIAVRSSAVAEAAARDAGFESFPIPGAQG